MSVGALQAAVDRTRIADAPIEIEPPRGAWQRIRVVTPAGAPAPAPPGQPPHLDAGQTTQGPFKWSGRRGLSTPVLVADVPLGVVSGVRSRPRARSAAVGFDSLRSGGESAVDVLIGQLFRQAGLLPPGSNCERPRQIGTPQQAVDLLNELGWTASRLGDDVHVTFDGLPTFEQVHVGLGPDGVRMRLPLVETMDWSESSFAAALLVCGAAHEWLPLVRVLCNFAGRRREWFAEVQLDIDSLDSPWTSAALAALRTCAGRIAQEMRALGDEALASSVLEGAHRRSRNGLSKGGRNVGR